ncbi:MAG: T9SS type A sorting domain-containing protein [Chitinophagales bacterium]|nr:T9SS type A sorting domain-containing protein [Chitinophagales bacterium]
MLSLTQSVFAQSADWKYIRPTNTGTGGSFHEAITVDRFNNKWTGGYEPFWSEGSVVRFDDSVWTCWSDFEGYLPSDRVRAIAFDLNDHVWVGTDGGLAHYDGISWEQFTISNSPLPYDQINGIAVDSNNHIWMSYSEVGGLITGGIAEYDGTEWTIYTTTTSGLPTSIVSNVDFDSGGDLWINSNAGIVKYDGLNWITFTSTNSELTTNDNYSMTVDEDDRVWISGYGWIDMYDGTDWVHYDATNSPLTSQILFDIDVRNDTVLVAGLYSAYTFIDEDWDSYILPNWAIECAIDYSGNFWLAGTGYVIKFNDSEWIEYSNYNVGMSEYFNEDIFIDSKNRKWIANGNGGINMFDCPIWEDYGPWNANLFPMPIDYTTIGAAVTEDIYGDIWMAYAGVAGGVVQIPNGDVHDPDAWIVWENDNSGVNIQFIECIASDIYGNVWVGLDGGGISVYWHDSETWENFYAALGFTTNYIDDLYADQFGRIWIADYQLDMYEDGVWTTFSHADMGISPDESVLTAKVDSAGVLWVGTSVGLLRYEGVEWTIFDEGNSDIAANYVSAIAIGNGDTIFVGAQNTSSWPYYGGLSVFDGENFTSYLEGSSPIPHKQVEDVEVDVYGNLWILAQSEGIAIFNEGGVIGFDECIDMSLDTGVAVIDTTGGPDTTNSIITLLNKNILLSMYPNPVTEQSVITFTNTIPQNIRIEIADITGTITELQAAEYYTAGTHNIVFQAGNYAAGIYFCTLKTDEGSVTKKFIIQ